MKMIGFFRRNVLLPLPSPSQPSPEDGVPMTDVPRLSTETQRRNGFRQSHAPDRETRIIEDIRNGA